MHAQRPLEYCFVCGEPTGRAGQGEDSFYCACDKGPFCEDCWDIHHNADTKVADLLKALEDIADGNASIPDNTLAEGRAYLTSYMWTYSQERARKAIAKAKK